MTNQFPRHILVRVLFTWIHEPFDKCDCYELMLLRKCFALRQRSHICFFYVACHLVGIVRFANAYRWGCKWLHGTSIFQWLNRYWKCNWWRYMYLPFLFSESPFSGLQFCSDYILRHKINIIHKKHISFVCEQYCYVPSVRICFAITVCWHTSGKPLITI